MKIKLNIILSAILISIAHLGFAQKFAYINSAEILTTMPEIKAADAEVESYQSILRKQGQQMVQDLKAKYDALDERDKRGELSPKMKNDEVESLKIEEQKLGEAQQNMSKQLQDKRHDLYQPILDKVNKAIDEIAKEAGYQFVFDTSTGILLYADPTQDISEKVKSKLGIKP